MEESENRRRLDPNLLIAVGVLIASFAALFVYMRQASIMSEQTRILLEQTKANAWPHLRMTLVKSYKDSRLYMYQIVIANKGTGPAIIEDVVISYDGKPVESWNEFFRAIEIPDSIPISYGNENIHEQVMSSNEELTIINFSNFPGTPDNTDLMEYIFSKGDKIKIEICYSSIHGDRWQVVRTGFQSDLESNDMERIEECRSGEKTFKQ